MTVLSGLNLRQVERQVKALIVLLLFAAVSSAHVGNSDIYFDGNAGPYRLFVTIRPPLVIPGVAQVEIRTETQGVEEIHAVPVALRGAAARFAPVPDKLSVSSQDGQFFTGSLWMMVTGSWQVRLTVHGTRGDGILSVPVPMAAASTKGMQAGLGVTLAFLLLLLVAGMVAIIGAAVRESRLARGVLPSPRDIRSGRVAMAVGFFVLAVIIGFGGRWWLSAADAYDQKIYKPLQMRASIDSNDVLTLKMTDPGWLKQTGAGFGGSFFVRKIDDLVLDHEHLMHLYAIREPGLDTVYHLHPELVGAGVFRLTLPTMLAGRYKLYADVVHENGFPETMVASVQVPTLGGRALAGDDATGSAAAWQSAPLASTFTLPDGYHMEWLRGTEPLRAKAPAIFRFRLTDPAGRAPAHMELYMGMIGHAAFVKTDGTAFAHIHPSGSVNMAALMLAEQQSSGAASLQKASMGAGLDMPGMSDMALPNEAGFPYGFPSSGRYRIFVQMKHDETIETAIFDAEVH